MDKPNTSEASEDHNKMRKPESNRGANGRDVIPGSDLWTDGLICAFEYVRGRRKSITDKTTSRTASRQQGREVMKMPVQANGQSESYFSRNDNSSLLESLPPYELREHLNASSEDFRDSQIHSGRYHPIERFEDSHWISIGWARISELVQNVQSDSGWAAHQLELMDTEDGLTVADLAAPYWERPAGPVWWCHVDAGNPSVQSWLTNAHWLHPAISLALRDESRLISERMKHLLYEVICLFNSRIF